MARLAPQAFNAAVAFTNGGLTSSSTVTSVSWLPRDASRAIPRSISLGLARNEVGHDRAVGVVPIAGFVRDAAAFRVLRSRTPWATFLLARCYLCAK
jgi:hypothetical protein